LQLRPEFKSLAGGTVSVQTIFFMEAMLRTMYLSDLKRAGVVALVVVVAGTGLGLASYQAFGRAEAAAPVAKDEKAPPEKADPNDKLRQEVKQLQLRVKAAQERQQLEDEIKKLRAQLDQLEGKPLIDGKIPGVTYQGKGVDHWLGMLRDCEPTTRLSGLRAMAAIGDELGDDAPRVAAAITVILKVDGVVPLVAEVTPLTPDALPRPAPVQPETVQLQALYALAAMGPSAKVAIPKLVAMQLDVDQVTNAMFDHAVQNVRAAPMLGMPPAGLPAHLNDDTGASLVTPVLQRIDPDGKLSLPLVAAELQKGKPRKHVAENAIAVYHRYKEKASPWSVALVHALRVDDNQVQYDAMQLLREMGDAAKPAAVKALIALAKSKEKGSADAAAGVLHELYPEEAKDSGVPFAAPPTGAPQGGA
jgi:hypothetical protein